MVIEDILPGVNPEGSNTEFKRQLDEGKSRESGRAVENNRLRTFVAYANTSGGVMYACVDDRTRRIIFPQGDSGESRSEGDLGEDCSKRAATYSTNQNRVGVI